MLDFRDMCWQVRYEGGLAEIIRDFVEPLSVCAVHQEVHVWSLNRECLLPLTMPFAQCRKLDHPLRLLISPLSEECEATSLEENEFARASAMAVESLAWFASGAGVGVAQSPSHVARTLDVRIQRVLTGDVAQVSPTRCVGFARDASGNIVQYVADWGESSGAAGTKYFLNVSWSWGDPSRTVTTGLHRFEQVWSGENGQMSWTADDVLTGRLEGALDELIAQPCVEVDQPKKRELFRHQREAVDNWMARDCRGIFQMCTGAGKTIASLAAVKKLADTFIASGEKIPAVVVTVPTRILADQWTEEIKAFGYPTVLQAYNSFAQWFGRI